jgi:hypothetical protein
MEESFVRLYHSLESALRALDEELPPVDRYYRGIALIRDAIQEMRQEKRDDLAYFREVWPLFHSKLFLNQWLYGFEERRLSLVKEEWAPLVDYELGLVKAFFARHGTFWRYYQAGETFLDAQFSSGYDKALLLNSLAQVMGEIPLASYRAARCGAMEAYRIWLQEERERLLGPTLSLNTYDWGATDTDFVEWVYALFVSGAIRYQGQAADLGHVIKWARGALNKEIPNIHDRFKVLRSRKKERSVFMKRMLARLEQYMDQADGRME